MSLTRAATTAARCGILSVAAVPHDRSDSDSEIEDCHRLSDDELECKSSGALIEEHVNENCSIILGVVSEKAHCPDWAVKLCKVVQKIADRPDIKSAVFDELNKAFPNTVKHQPIGSLPLEKKKNSPMRDEFPRNIHKLFRPKSIRWTERLVNECVMTSLQESKSLTEGQTSPIDRVMQWLKVKMEQLWPSESPELTQNQKKTTAGVQNVSSCSAEQAWCKGATDPIDSTQTYASQPRSALWSQESMYKAALALAVLAIILADLRVKGVTRDKLVTVASFVLSDLW